LLTRRHEKEKEVHCGEMPRRRITDRGNKFMKTFTRAVVVYEESKLTTAAGENMKKMMVVFAISSVLLMPGAFNVKANSNYSGKVGADSLSNSSYSNFSALLEGSVLRWDAISTSNMSFGRMTIYENRNSKKITWRSGQSSPYILISENDGVTIIHLTAAPKFDGDRCRYLKMVFTKDIVTVNFYKTESALDQNIFFMEGSYEQVKSPMK
jgi:hypothetical protein